MKPSFCIVPYNSEDLEACLKLFHDTVHSVNSKDYNKEQLDAWAPEDLEKNKSRWQEHLEKGICFVAKLNSHLVGFADMTDSGHLHGLYVHKDFQGQGIASKLLDAIEKAAKKLGLKALSTEGSITAYPFFQKKGSIVDKKQEKELRGVLFINYVMHKTL